MPVSFDLISDLNLKRTDLFDWTGKSTSLHCIVCGNVSDDLEVLKRTLSHLSHNYKNVIFIDGSLEHPNILNYPDRVDEIKSICKNIPGVIYLHNHVVLMNDTAIIGCNGWYGNIDEKESVLKSKIIQTFREQDIGYLISAIETLQINPKIEKIVIATNSVPSKILSFNSESIEFPDDVGPALCLLNDLNHKVIGWIFGTDYITIDCVKNKRFYVNNPKSNKEPYWPKRVEI